MRIENLTANPRLDQSVFVAAITGAHYAVEALPYVVMFYPGLKLNPFHELLYSGASEARTVIVPLSDLKTVEEINWGDRFAVHLHWLHGLLSSARSEQEANAIVPAVAERIMRWKQRGVKIIWTVHNVLPHQPRFPEAEQALHRIMAEQADLIHVMNEQTAALVKPWYELPPSRVACVPHPSYAGWYGNAVGKKQARQMLGVADDEAVFLFFGSIQPYKGLLELVQAFESLRAEQPARRMRLLIAGGVASEKYAQSVKRLAAMSVGVSVITRSIPEGHVQVYFNAADVTVAPYTRTLNSGVALLAATFRRPMVAPAMGAMMEVMGADHPLLYDATDDDGLLSAMRRSLDHIPEPGYFDRILERHEPGRISAEFFAEVKKMFDRKPRARRRHSQGRKK